MQPSIREEASVRREPSTPEHSTPFVSTLEFSIYSHSERAKHRYLTCTIYTKMVYNWIAIKQYEPWLKVPKSSAMRRINRTNRCNCTTPWSPRPRPPPSESTSVSSLRPTSTTTAPTTKPYVNAAREENTPWDVSHWPR